MSGSVATDSPCRGRPWASPLVRGYWRTEPTDFLVSEQLGFEPDGQGEHLLLHVRKRARNTLDVVQALQHRFGVGSVDIGYAGLKDRTAVAEQWFSVRTTQLPDAMDGLFDEHLHWLGAFRHSRKLRRGAHAANRFVLRLQGVRALHAPGAADPDAGGGAQGLRALGDTLCVSGSDVQARVETRLQRIAAEGFPNYLGPQRFGREGRTWHGAYRALVQVASAGGQRKRLTRAQRSLYLSALRSELFNRVLDARVAAGSWREALDGEPLMLDGTHSVFVPDGQDTEIAWRLASGDVHTTGPWAGDGGGLARAACAGFEASILADAHAIVATLGRAGLRAERRALRAMARELAWHWPDTDCLQLEFALGPGVFATSLLAELGHFTEPERS